MSILRVGKVEGVTPTRWQRVWAERFPKAPLEMIDVEVAQQRAAVIGDEVDMCFARLPIERDGLHAIPLYDEVQVAWMSRDHVLGELDELTTSDLADERVLRDATPENIELASYCAAVLHVPLSIARSGSRKDLVLRPIVDAEPTTVALVWRIDDPNPLLDEFIGVVRGRTPASSRSARERGASAAIAASVARTRTGGVGSRRRRPRR